MISWRLAASTLTRSFRNYNMGSVVRSHICPAFARTLERHCSYKTRNGEVLKQEPDCSEPRQQASHENSSDFKTQAVSCSCFFCLHQTGPSTNESRNHQIFLTEFAASCSAAKVAGTGVNC